MVSTWTSNARCPPGSPRDLEAIPEDRIPKAPPWRNSPEIHDRSAVGSAKRQVSPVWAVKKVKHITEFLCAIGHEDSLDHPVPGRYISHSRPLSQAVRPRIANPLPPVRIREGPLQRNICKSITYPRRPTRAPCSFVPMVLPTFASASSTPLATERHFMLHRLVC